MAAVLLRDLLNDPTFWEPRRRHPIVRSGERAPIPWVVRTSIARRDGHHCLECGWWMPDMDGLELDHILPWSAGGGDHSANLRCLCSPCNQDRSNWDDGVRERVPTTWWCVDCWLHPEVEAAWEREDWEGWQRRRRPVWRDGTDLNAAPLVTDGTHLVYCAWCWGYGTSDVAFIPGQQDDLAALVSPPFDPTGATA